MKRASHTLYKGDKVQLQYLYFFPLACLAQGKGRVLHRCWRNLYDINFNTFLKQSQGFYKKGKKQGFIETSTVKSKPERSKADFYSTLSISCLVDDFNIFLKTSQGFFKSALNSV